MRILLLILLVFNFPLQNSTNVQINKHKPLTNFSITQEYTTLHPAVDLISQDRKVYAIESCLIKEIKTPDWEHPIKSQFTPNGRAWSPTVKCSNEKYDFYYTHILTKLQIGMFLYPGQYLGNYYHLGNSTGPHLHLQINLKNTSITLNYMEFENAN